METSYFSLSSGMSQLKLLDFFAGYTFFLLMSFQVN